MNILLFFAPLTFVEYIFILLVYVNTIYVSAAFALILHKYVIKKESLEDIYGRPDSDITK